MKFGTIDRTELDSVDFSLPPDNIDPHIILGNKDKAEVHKIYVGCGNGVLKNG